MGQASDDALLTATDVVIQLSELGRELDGLVRAMKAAEFDAVTMRHEADMVESRAFVAAVGSVELRKHLARLASDGPEAKALVAESTCRWLKARIRSVEIRVEIGRSYGAAVRSELRTVGYAEQVS